MGVKFAVVVVPSLSMVVGFPFGMVVGFSFGRVMGFPFSVVVGFTSTMTFHSLVRQHRDPLARVDDHQSRILRTRDQVIQKGLHLQAIFHQHIGVGQRLHIGRASLKIVGIHIGRH